MMGSGGGSTTTENKNYKNQIVNMNKIKRYTQLKKQAVVDISKLLGLQAA